MDVQPFNIRTLVHHIEHLVLYSLIWWQIIFGLYILLKWIKKNIKFSTNSGSNSIFIDSKDVIGGGEVKNKSVGPNGPIEVDFKKDIFVDKADDVKIKSDVKKGKVKTQKDKLKKLRRS
jgi:hypothetical protein